MVEQELHTLQIKLLNLFISEFWMKWIKLLSVPISDFVSVFPLFEEVDDSLSLLEFELISV